MFNLKLIASVDTIAKKHPIQASLLQANQIVNVAKHKIFPIEKWEFAENDHLLVSLGHSSGDWYFYNPHVAIVDRAGTILDNPFTPPIIIRSLSKKLSERDLQLAADFCNCSVAALKAVVAVESVGSGFLADGRPKILFEAHWFSHFTDRRYDLKYPGISSRRWNRNLYLGGEKEYARLNAAVLINKKAAYQSCSWGLGQVMGFHWKMCGFSSVEEFVEAQYVSEFEQLKCMVAFLKSKKLDRALRELNWKTFAYGYNGESFAINKYDEKLAIAYRQFC